MPPSLAAVFALFVAPALAHAQTSLDRFNGFEGGGPGDYQVATGSPSASATAHRTGQFGLSTNAAAGANTAISVGLSSPTALLIDRIWACVATAPVPIARRIRSWRSGAQTVMELILISGTPSRVQLRVLNNPIGNFSVNACPSFSEIEVEYRAVGSGGLAALRVDGAGTSDAHFADDLIDSTVIGPDDGANSPVGVVWDDHGIVLGTTFPSDVRIQGMPPTSFLAASAFDDWTAFGCAEKVDCIREQPPDGSLTFLFSGTVDHRQSICLEAASAHGVFGSILSVKDLVVAKGTAPLPTIGLFLRLNAPECGGISGFTSDDFTPVLLGGQFAGAARYDSTSPGGGAWTEAQLNPTALLIRFMSGAGQAQVTQVLREVAFDPAGSPSPTSTSTPTPTPTRTRTSTPTRTPTSSATPSLTASRTPTATPSEAPSATPVPTATATTTFKPESTDTPTPSASLTPTPTRTVTGTVTATITQTPLPEPTTSATATTTGVSSATPTNSPTPTTVMSVSPSASRTETPVGFVTETPTETPISAPTETPSPSETATPTPTPTGPTATPTATFPRRLDYILTAGDTTSDEFICTQNLSNSLGFSSADSFDLGTLVNSDPAFFQRQYLAVYVVPGLSGTDYTNLIRLSAPGGFIDQFVSLGGVAILNVHGLASAANVAPRGVGYQRTPFGTNQETVQDVLHLYVTGDGYAGTPLGSSSFTGWNPTDQGFLTDLPADATVPLQNPQGQPTWAEYNHGNGRVIVTSLTYCTPSERATGSKALENLLKYGVFFTGLAQTPGLTVTPTATPTPTATGPTRTPTSARTATSTRTRTATPTATVSPTQTDALTSCPGDCNNDQMVAINELITGVNIAIESLPPSRCPAFDRNGNDQVEINELVAGVNAALNGCP